MSATKPLGTTGNGVGTVTPLDHKMAQLGLLTKTTTANLVRAGLFYNGNSTIVSGKANMSYDVAAFTAATTRGATAGATLLSNDGVYNVVTTAAPGSNSRYDVVYVWPREFSLDGTDSNPVIGVVQGTAAASPTVPSLSAYPGAIELARILVPAGVTATNSGTTITQTAPFTSVDGGVVAFRTTTEMNAWTSALTDQLAIDLSSAFKYRWNGSAWVIHGGLGPFFVVSRGSTQAISAGAWTLANSAWGSPDVSSGVTSFTSGRLTVATAGWYRLSFTNRWPAAASTVGFQVTKNSTSVDTSATILNDIRFSSSSTVGNSRLVYLAAADVLRVYVYSASAQNLGTNTDDLVLSLEWVRA